MKAKQLRTKKHPVNFAFFQKAKNISDTPLPEDFTGLYEMQKSDI